ncbi:MAG: hypothetical protein ACREUQ_09255, partial [Burkholderiales bacterium]
LITSLKKEKGGEDATVKMLFEHVLPMIQAAQTSRGPEAMAKLVEAMADAQSTSMAQLSEMVKNAASEQPDNPWFQIVDRGVRALTEVVQTMGETVRDGVSGPPTQQLTLTAGNADQITDAIMRSPNLPPELATDGWREIFRRLHARDDVEALARDIAQHLERLEQLGKLPQLFHGLFDTEEPAGAFLERLVANLPISQDKSYIRKLLVAFDAALPPSIPGEVVEEDEQESSQPA